MVTYQKEEFRHNINVNCRIRIKMNRWNIPEWLEEEVKARDKFCVYCGVLMVDKMPSIGSRKSVATWEHIINDASIITRGNIARCCASCNSSKGTKELSHWLESSYCKKKGINPNTVAPVVKNALNSKKQLTS